jgi:hypothetical protein
VVGFEVIAEQGQLESAAALKRPVAGSPVAAQAAEQVDHVPLKTGRFLPVGSGESLADRGQDVVGRPRLGGDQDRQKEANR